MPPTSAHGAKMNTDLQEDVHRALGILKAEKKIGDIKDKVDAVLRVDPEIKNAIRRVKANA